MTHPLPLTIFISILEGKINQGKEFYMVCIWPTYCLHAGNENVKEMCRMLPFPVSKEQHKDQRQFCFLKHFVTSLSFFLINIIF